MTERMSTRGSFIASVVSNRAVCREHFVLSLQVDRFPATRAGQFVQLQCRTEVKPAGPREIDWPLDGFPSLAQSAKPPGDPDTAAATALLRRPFSLAGRRDVAGEAIIDILHRVVGVGTAWLAALNPGDPVGVLGPLGNSFQHPRDGQQAILVGGGVGIPPMLYLANELAAERAGNAVAFAGATTRDLLPLTLRATGGGAEDVEPADYLGEFHRHGIASVVSTDDGSYGYRGYVTHALERFLDDRKISGDAAMIYVCGPEAMMKRVGAIAAERDIPCQIAVERAMACGMGTCQSCCIKVKKPDPAAAPMPGKAWCWRLACTDGPVFENSALLW